MSSGGVELSVEQLGNVTSADLVVVARCEIVCPQGTLVQGFADGDAVSQDAADHAVTRMGVDGFFAAGFVYREKTITMTLMPTSPFLEVLRQCLGTQHAMKRALQWDIDVTYPQLRGRGTIFNFITGVYSNGAELPAARETLDNVTAQFKFARVDQHPA